jgi:uncharacterized protein YkwD
VRLLARVLACVLAASLFGLPRAAGALTTSPELVLSAHALAASAASTGSTIAVSGVRAGGAADLSGGGTTTITSTSVTTPVAVGSTVPVLQVPDTSPPATRRAGQSTRQVAGTLPDCPVDASTGQPVTTPFVTSVTPGFGPTSGSTLITVNGGNFTGCEVVKQSYTYSQGSIGPPPTPDSITVTSTVTTYQFVVTGLELDSTTSPTVKLGAETVYANTNNQFQALTPPGPICTATTSMTLTVDASVTSQTFTFTTTWTGTQAISLGPPYPSPPYPGYPGWPNLPSPMTCDVVAALNAQYPSPPYSPGVCTVTSQSPTVSTTTSNANPNVTFVYVNEGAQVVACGQNGPYDIANGNAVTVQMANELFADVNAERANYDLLHPGSPQLAPLVQNSALVQVAAYWANAMASGAAPAGAGGSVSIASVDGCALPEVVASGYGSGSSIIWAAENAGVFAGTANTGMMNALFATASKPPNVSTITQGNAPTGGSSCAGTGGAGTVSVPSTEHNYFSNTYTDLGVAVSCAGGSAVAGSGGTGGGTGTGTGGGSGGGVGGICFVAEVFGGHDINTPVQPDCADANFTGGFSCPSPSVTGGGTQAVNVLPAAPTGVRATIAAMAGTAGGGYSISASWDPPPAEGYDPVNMYVIDIFDVNTGVPCMENVGPNVTADAASGCVINGNVVPFANDQYAVSVRAVNDLCVNGCAPSALYPPPQQASQQGGSTCNPFGSHPYPACAITSSQSSPDGPWQLASPDPLVWGGATCIPNPVAGNGQCNPPSTQAGLGYRMVALDGGVFAYGSDGFFGSMGGQPLVAPMVAMAGAPGGGGYWLVGADGGVFTFGDAAFYGSLGGKPLAAPVVAIAATFDGRGYWLLGQDGGVFAFGDAQYLGSPKAQPTCGSTLSGAAATGIVASPNGEGYWVVSSAGQVFAYGNVSCLGSAPAGLPACSSPSGAPPCMVVGMTATADGEGYWLVDDDGDVYAFGDAVSYGQAPGSLQKCSASPGSSGYYVVSGTAAACPTIIGIVSTPDGKGYWLLTASGAVNTYGDATYSGSPSTLPLNMPVVGIEEG